MRSASRRMAFLLAALLLLTVCRSALTETAMLMPVTGTVTVNGAAIRTRPTKAVPKLISLTSGAAVTVTGVLENAEGTWLKVVYEQAGGSCEGYMRMEYVSAELIGLDGEPVRIPVSMRVSAKAECGAYNHVGYRWQKEFFVDGELISASVPITLVPGDTLTLSACLTEADAYPDSGWGHVTKTVSREELESGFVVNFSVSVAENRGRYSGNECVWTVTFRFTKA